MTPVDLDALLRERTGLRVVTSESQVAAALWDFGEDALAARAIAMTTDELTSIERIAAWYEDPNHPLPVTGRITHRHVTALAAVTLFERRLRPLARSRRRPERDRPAAYTPLPPDPGRR